MEGADLIGKGMLFHSLGGAKVQSPLSLNLDHRTVKNPKSADRGLYTQRETLKSALNLTGNQLREARISVIWSLLRIPVRSLAAAFRISCRQDRDD